MGSLCQLPPPLVQTLILGRCDVVTLLRLAQVSHQMYAWARSNSAWYQHRDRMLAHFPCLASVFDWRFARLAKLDRAASAEYRLNTKRRRRRRGNAWVTPGGIWRVFARRLLVSSHIPAAHSPRRMACCSGLHARLYGMPVPARVCIYKAALESCSSNPVTHVPVRSARIEWVDPSTTWIVWIITATDTSGFTFQMRREKFAPMMCGGYQVKVPGVATTSRAWCCDGSFFEGYLAVLLACQ